jgi:hypothetical protein
MSDRGTSRQNVCVESVDLGFHQLMFVLTILKGSFQRLNAFKHRRVTVVHG